MQLKPTTPSAGQMGMENGKLFLGSYRWLQQSPFLHKISSIDLGFNCTECNQMPSWRTIALIQKGLSYETIKLSDFS